VAKYLPHKCKALSLYPSIAKKNFDSFIKIGNSQSKCLAKVYVVKQAKVGKIEKACKIWEPERLKW
jgi:hypothetical protein